MSWGYVNFHPIIEGKSLGGAMHVQTFLCRLCHEDFMRSGECVEGLDGDAKSMDECVR